MTRKTTLFGTLLSAVAITTLGGCAAVEPQAASAAAQPETLFALGTEPFWTLEITPTLINFAAPGRAPLRIANPGARREPDSERYVTRSITVDVRYDYCNDGMSDRRYPETVTIEALSQTWRGCGGSPAPRAANSLDRSSWRLIGVNGQPAVVGVEADLAFADGQLSGTAGCNRLTGSYMQARNPVGPGPAQSRDALEVDHVATTRMACAGPRRDQERAVLAVLNQPMTIAWGARMTMTLTALDGTRIELRRLDFD